MIVCPALILCGGIGSRLQPAVSDVPKVLALVGGRPFLDILLERLRAAGLRRFVLLTGYRSDQIERHVEALVGWDIALSVETVPLGTAGAVRQAARYIDGTFFLLNGDTWLDLDAAGLLAAHRAAGALVTVAACSVPDASRYGALQVSADGCIRGFLEKGGVSGPGLVNAGVYVAEPGLLEHIPAGPSLERETLPELIAAGARVQAAPQPGEFVDIGTVESYTAFATGRRSDG